MFIDPAIEENKKRRLVGVSSGILFFILSAGFYAVAVFMVGTTVLGCPESPPEWLYMIVVIGFPIPLLITTFLVPYLFIKRKKWPLIVLTIVAGIFMSCIIYLIFFIILTQYC